MPTQFEKWTEQEKEDALAKMIEIAENGGHQAAMCIALGIKSEDTFYRWKREFPEFKEMCEQAKLHSKATYEKIGLKGMMGDISGFNATTYALTMNNKFRDEYKPPNDAGNTITHNTLNINLSADELSYKIAQKLEVLRSFGEEIKVIDHDKDL
jgi:hypothetical protein